MAQESPEARELRLVDAVELRIALAETQEQLEQLLNKYLAPLLLKLASDSPEVRKKVIAICQHVNLRLRPLKTFKLPMAALLEQFRQVENSLVRSFDLVYVKQGLNRMEAGEQVKLLPTFINGIAGSESSKQAANLFHIILSLLPLYELPAHGTPEDATLRSTLRMSDDDAAFLAKWFTKVLLLSKTHILSDNSHPGLSSDEFSFVNHHLPFKRAWDPTEPDGLDLMKTKFAVAHFLTSRAFHDSERFIGSVVMLADPNHQLADISDNMHKHHHFDFENGQMVDDLYALYLGSDSPEVIAPALPNIQIKILDFLGKSIVATSRTDSIRRLIQMSLSRRDDHQPVGLEGRKLRSRLFSFITWVARAGDTFTLQTVAPIAIRCIRDFIDNQGWPDPSACGRQLNSTDLHARSLVYETLGVLVAKIDRSEPTDELVSSDLELLSWLFSSFCTDHSTNQISVSIDQALGSFLNALSKMVNNRHDASGTTIVAGFRNQLSALFTRFMLLEEGEKDPRTSYTVIRNARYICLRFANRCLPFSHIGARWLNLVALGKIGHGERPEVIEEAKKGLDPYWYMMANGWTLSATLDREHFEFPRFDRLTSFLFDPEGKNCLDMSMPSRFSKLGRNAHQPELETAHIASLAPAVRFCRNILLCEAFARAGLPADSNSDWNRFLEAKMSADEHHRDVVRRFVGQEENTPSVRLLLNAALSGLLYTDADTGRGYGRSECGSYFIEIAALASNALLEPLAKCADSALFQDTLFSNELELQDVASRAFSILTSHPGFPIQLRAEIISSHVSSLSSWYDASGSYLNKIRGLLSVAADIVSRTYLRRNSESLPRESVQKLISQLFEMVCNAHDASVRKVVHRAVGQLSLAGAITSASFSGTNEETGKQVIKNLSVAAKCESETAILALSSLASAFGFESPCTADICECLYSLHEIKQPEVHFTIGEGLSIIAMGRDSRALLTYFDVDTTLPTLNRPDEAVAGIFDKVIAGCQTHKPSLRKASAIWLLCLMRYCSESDVIKLKLRQCQTTFLQLLSDRDEFVQETASRGLSLVYDMGTQQMKDELICDIVQSFTSEKNGKESVFGGGRVTHETKIFNPGTIPTGEGTSVSTYKDIVDLASEAGDPSLIYRFMSLASSNAIWSSRVALGQFGLSSFFSDSAISGHLSKNPIIYAKLYRYRFDPNPKVQRSMNDIWNAVVKDSNAAVNEHFDLIIRDLLSSILNGREWRVREASCAAIADLVQGRQLEKYEPYLDELLTKAFKVLDDIRGSVRAAALKLCIVLTNIAIRMLEKGDANQAKRPRIMLDHLVPFLLGQGGMSSSVQDAQSHATSTMCQIVKQSPPKLLQPYVPDIMEQFLNTLSTFEPEAINYVYLNADKYGLTGHEIDKMRLSAIRSSPLMECIELHIIDAIDPKNAEAISDVAEVLERVLRSAIGFPSKLGVSRVISILCSKPLLFKPHANHFMRLMRNYVLDTNITISASYSSCLGYLARLADSREVLCTMRFARSSYFTSDTGDESLHHRSVAADIIHAMVKKAPDQMVNYNSVLVPFVFLAKNDQDGDIRKQFEYVWKERVGGTRAISSLYFKEIMDLVLENIDSPKWHIQCVCAFAIAETIDAVLFETGNKTIDSERAGAIWPAVTKAITGRVWKGKQYVLDAFVRYCRAAGDFRNQGTGIQEQMLAIVVLEATRRGRHYKRYTLRALGDFSRGRLDLHTLKDSLPVARLHVDEIINKQQNSGIDQDTESRRIDDEILSAAVYCILGCINPFVDDEREVSAAIEVVEKAVQYGNNDALLALYSGLDLGSFDAFANDSTALAPAVIEQAKNNITALGKCLLFRNYDHAESGYAAIRLKRAEISLIYSNMKLFTSLSSFLSFLALLHFEPFGFPICRALPFGEARLTSEVCLSTSDTPIKEQQQTGTTGQNARCLVELLEELDEASRIADIAYCIPTPGVYKPFKCLGRCRDFRGFELVKIWNTGPLLSDSTGYLALSHLPGQKRIIIAFRGTYSFANVIADLSVAPQVYVPLVGEENNGKHRCDNCTVHSGFMRSWANGREAVNGDLERLVRIFPDYQLTVVGHSLGGAVATLAGLEFLLRGWAPHVITFGQPRVGNLRFSNFLDEHFRLNKDRDAATSSMLSSPSPSPSPSFHRVTRVNDPIPLLPLSEWGYAPHSGEVYIATDKLPVLASDLHICVGRNDTNCSAGQESRQSNSAGRDAAFIVSAAIESDEEVESHPLGDLFEQTSQTPMAKGILRVPARYRMWELFFAHRDYFHRLGLCTPHPDGLP
ncbi:proteasome component M29 [Ascosphaera aggregata]|nr:proteasome component M29 [Ascosphaera aggregata]